jgi:quercetin dioxygenase-like cupin family protein
MGFEPCKIPQGEIMIAFSDENLSVGTLEINPNQELSKHDRPVLESLFQLRGKCMIKLFGEDGSVKEMVLGEGESMDIPPKSQHMHTNPFDEVSLTFWKASGDITEIINKIRENSRM